MESLKDKWSLNTGLINMKYMSPILFGFSSINYARTWWGLFQERVVCAKLDNYALLQRDINIMVDQYKLFLNKDGG